MANADGAPPAASWVSSRSRRFARNEPGSGSFFLLRASKAATLKSMCSFFAAASAVCQPTTTGMVWKKRVSVYSPPLVTVSCSSFISSSVAIDLARKSSLAWFFASSATAVKAAAFSTIASSALWR